MSKYNLSSWNTSMSTEMHLRFESYRTDINKRHKKKISKSEFGRMMFISWEKMYLECLNQMQDAESTLNNLISKDNEIMDDESA